MSLLQFLKTTGLNNNCNIVLSYKAVMSVAAFHQTSIIIKDHIQCWPSKEQETNFTSFKVHKISTHKQCSYQLIILLFTTSTPSDLTFNLTFYIWKFGTKIFWKMKLYRIYALIVSNIKKLKSIGSIESI
jgi:hypothetical protein